MSVNRRSIIIIGTGKAALLHLAAYTRLWDARELPKLYIVAGDFVEPEIEEIVKQHSAHIQFKPFEFLSGQAQSDSVVDICTPTHTHRNIIEKMCGLGFRRFIVEKPLVTTVNDLDRIKSLNIRLAIMQNYMFSQATQRVLNLIKSGKILPKFMLSFFCKNRIQDAGKMRGFNDSNPPHVFTIELPHQLYLASAFMGGANVFSVHAESMHVGETLFSEHGAGTINLKHLTSGVGGFGKFQSSHFSCLFSDQCIRRLLIIDHDERTITVDYPSTMGILTSRIEIQNSKECIYQEVFENDDMMTWALKHYCECMFTDDSAYADGHHNHHAIVDTLLVFEALSKVNISSSSVVTGKSTCRNCDKLCKHYSVSLPCLSLKRK